jgi:pimeloyl-ACP methyl ester carboxylesterase
MTRPVRAYAIRGLAGQIFSRGMNTLADELNAVDGVRCSVEDEASWFPYDHVPMIAKTAREAAAAGAAIVLIGHSMGGDAAMRVAVALGRDGIEVPLVACIDPTTFGCPQIPPNVIEARDYYQKVDPIGRGVLVPSAEFAALLRERKRTLIQERHDMPHIVIDDSHPIHIKIVAAVKALAAGRASENTP